VWCGVSSCILHQIPMREREPKKGAAYRRGCRGVGVVWCEILHPASDTHEGRENRKGVQHIEEGAGVWVWYIYMNKV